ncbi:MAG TPA: hypothetical protein VHZ50_01780, partial [Puia sp.]|nr:hypothetical protein [Puia sp.]
MSRSFNKAAYRLLSILFLVFMLQVQSNAQSIEHATSVQKKFDEFSKHFVKGYQALNMPELELSYVANLQHIKSFDSVKKQLGF